MRVVHPIPPVYDAGATVLILGSFPSVLSRQNAFFYGNPQNRFWRVLPAVLGEKSPDTVAEKKAFLHRNGIALWDVIGSCEITGSADASIRAVIPNDLSTILDACPIGRIFCNGKKAYELYRKYAEKSTGRTAICLPSTSPANAAWSETELCEAWACVKGKEESK